MYGRQSGMCKVCVRVRREGVCFSFGITWDPCSSFFFAL